MYLPMKVFGLPKSKHKGWNTSKKPKYHMYVVKIAGYTYYKIHLKRQDKSKIKYFKSKLQAQLFLESLKINPYL